MAFAFLAILFFTITFAPRLFQIYNLEYGFFNLGLGTNLLAHFADNEINPYIPALQQHFFAARPQPWFILLWPVAHFAKSPAVFLFLDEAAVVLAAWVCARFVSVKLRSSEIAIAVFFALLFSPVEFEALHAPANTALWCQVPLLLLVAEYLDHRRPKFLALWFTVVCCVHLAFAPLGLVLAALTLLTRRQRWNLTRRVVTATPLAVIAALSAIFLKLLGGQIEFDTDLFFQINGPILLNWGLSFLFMQVLAPEVIVISLLLLTIRIDGGAHDPVLIWGLGALAVGQGLHLLVVTDRTMKRVVAGVVAATCLLGQWRSSDLLYHFWKVERWQVSPQARQILDMLGKIPRDASVAVSDSLTVPLADHKGLITLAVARGRLFLPEYVATGGEPTIYDKDNRYTLLEANSQTGARLLKRIK